MGEGCVIERKSMDTSGKRTIGGGRLLLDHI